MSNFDKSLLQKFEQNKFNVENDLELMKGKKMLLSSRSHFYLWSELNCRNAGFQPNMDICFWTEGLFSRIAESLLGGSNYYRGRALLSTYDIDTARQERG